MVLYKQYDDARFQAYKGGNWNNRLETFEFGNEALNVGGYSLSLKHTEVIYPEYDNSFCNKFMSLMNSVRFRNDNSIFKWLQSLNSMNYSHLLVVGEKGRALVEESFKIIENYGIMTYGKENEKQRN